MDERQMDIKERAGLEETKFDQNFLNWFNKWGNRILWLALIALGLYVGNQWFGKWQRAQIDKAFSEYQEVFTIDPTPEAMLAVASKHGGTRGIGSMARLAAADQYLSAVRQGLVVGAILAPDGTLLTQDDALSDEDRAFYLDQAQTQYQMVFDENSADSDLAIHAMGAGFGMAAVAESRGELEKAGEWYTRVEALAGEHGYTDVVTRAAEMRGALAELEVSPRLYARAELPEPPATQDPIDRFDNAQIQEILRQMQEEQAALEGVGDLIGDDSSGEVDDAGDGTGDESPGEETAEDDESGEGDSGDGDSGDDETDGDGSDGDGSGGG